MLTQAQSQAELTLAKKTIEGDYCFLKFTFSDPEKVLGHRIGQSVRVTKAGDKQVWRHYIPISRLDEQGTADFLVKLIDQKPEIDAACEFSKLLRVANIGDKFLVKGPYSNWVYEGFGKISVAPVPLESIPKTSEPAEPKTTSEPRLKGQFDNIVMIAHDNAVTAFFTLIDTVSTFPKDHTSLTLIYFVDKLVACSDPGRPRAGARAADIPVDQPSEPEDRTEREADPDGSSGGHEESLERVDSSLQR